jgi:metal-responsive CopG/Arc/MetJ family transcriptional regulator
LTNERFDVYIYTGGYTQMIRMNITLPDRVAQKLNKVNNKSRFIAEAVEEKMVVQEKQKTMEVLSQQYKEMAVEEKASMKDWEMVDTEGWE